MAFAISVIFRHTRSVHNCLKVVLHPNRRLSNVKKNFVKPYQGVHFSNLDKTIPCPFCKEMFRVDDALNFHIGNRHSARISETLRQNPIDTYSRILTNKEVKRLSSTELRYPEGLVIQLDGEHKGNWYSFTHSVGGGPLRALRMFQNLSVQEAAKRGLEIIQMQVAENVAEEVLSSNKEKGLGRVHSRPDRNEEQRMETAQSIWEVSEDLKGTLGEKYLIEQRKIPRRYVRRLDFRFLPEGAIYKDFKDDKFVDVQNRFPALLIRVLNAQRQLSGVQRVFLSKVDGSRPLWMPQNKFSKGILQSCAGIVQLGEEGHDVFVVEGPETGASIVTGLLNKCLESSVIATLSMSNLVNVLDVLMSFKPKRVIFAMDNDGEGTETSKRLDQMCSTLSKNLNNNSVPVLRIKPPGTEKSDWNDVLRTKGVTQSRKLMNHLLRKEEDKLNPPKFERFDLENPS